MCAETAVPRRVVAEMLELRCTRACCAPKPDELELLRLLAEGLTNLEIARRLVVSPDTIKKRLDVVRQKLHASNRTAVVAVALRSGLIT